MTEFSHFLGGLEPSIHEFGSVAIFIILMLESFGLPLPGESLLIMAAILAGRGEISFSALLLSAWGGAVAGDNIGYLIGRILGHKLLQRYGRKMGLKPDRLRQAEAIFARYGPIAVGFARFFNILRQLNGVVAGALEMHWLRFLVFNALGGARPMSAPKRPKRSKANSGACCVDRNAAEGVKNDGSRPKKRRPIKVAAPVASATGRKVRALNSGSINSIANMTPPIGVLNVAAIPAHRRQRRA